MNASRRVERSTELHRKRTASRVPSFCAGRPNSPAHHDSHPRRVYGRVLSNRGDPDRSDYRGRWRPTIRDVRKCAASRPGHRQPGGGKAVARKPQIAMRTDAISPHVANRKHAQLQATCLPATCRDLVRRQRDDRSLQRTRRANCRIGYARKILYGPPESSGAPRRANARIYIRESAGQAGHTRLRQPDLPPGATIIHATMTSFEGVRKEQLEDLPGRAFG